MSTAISATSTASISEGIFAKLDTQKKGYLDAADLKNAAGSAKADDASAAEAFKQIDTDGDGKVTKSELSAAIDKVGDELNAQLDQSRLKSASVGGKPPAGSGGGGGAPRVESGSSESETAASKYVAAADTNSDGTVSADEAAAYKKSQARTEAKAQAQVQEYMNNGNTSGVVASASVDVLA
jgi:Ca2+-binding EF-hand superfamily protein